ncbi:MAG: efflux RND transporter periplasmic adaptor subunit [Magnetococcales bacterium]|nr:efflux RND transporter periplasmic adaptor subunit [Magnetococcales bacterium]
MSRALTLLAIGLSFCLQAGPAWAHGGEDHGADAGSGQPLLASLGAGAAGDRFEAVVTPNPDGSLRLSLADLADNRPLADATIEAESATSPPWTGPGEATPTPGVYRLAWQPPTATAADLTLTVTAAGQADLILLQVPAAVTQPMAAVKADLAAPTPGGPAVRTVALPKASQFLLDLRTTAAAGRGVTDSLRLVGRVIPDPAFHARVHPQGSARVVHDPDFPPPRSGQRVKHGETLAVLDPILSPLDRAGQRLTLARGERGDTLVTREMVQAPIDGQLTDVHIVPGEVVTENSVLVEIIDPAHLWVEAVLYDLPLAERITGGTATTRQIPGRAFPLVLAGVSPKVNPENQGLHLQFAMTDTGGQIKIGMPVDVYAQTGMVAYGVAIPRPALLDRSGQYWVWVKTAPERFEGRTVRPGRRTAEWVEILEGLQPGDRVVVQGHNQLDAVR